ncbi:MAG: hypothetical protein M3N02_07225 [Pseudomonadota bacterium]|nr:hypothetical protein [Pseudomonadota bacterium]
MAYGPRLLPIRQPIYELDWIGAIEPAATPRLYPDLLAPFSVGYRHLAYLLSGLGFDVARDLPGTRGPMIDALRERIWGYECG